MDKLFYLIFACIWLVLACVAFYFENKVAVWGSIVLTNIYAIKLIESNK